MKSNINAHAESGDGVAVQRMVRLCACGCGKELGPNSKGKIPTWWRGHNHRGTKHSDGWSDKQSKGLKRAWADPAKMINARHPNREIVEARAAKSRGLKRTDEVRQAIRARMLGYQPTAETRAKLSEIGKARKPTESQLDALRKHRRGGSDTAEMKRMAALIDWEQLRQDNSARMKMQVAEWKAIGQLDEIRRKAKNLKGLPDHIAAKSWVVRDPCGRTYHFSNLREWARQHEHLFEDDRPESRQPFAARIANGLSEMWTKGKTCSYRGWVAVSNSELRTGAPDLLARNTQPNDRGKS